MSAPKPLVGRYDLRNLRVTKVAVVDKPAQAGATITHIAKRDFGASERKTDAKSGAAMPDGSFPIENGSDLSNAIQAWGRASDKAAAARHIKSRASALGLTDKLPTSGPLAEAAGTAKRATKESTMPTIEELQEEIKKSQAVIKRLTLVVALSAVAKSHYDSLGTDEARDAFLGQSADEQLAVAKRAAEGDPVVAIVDGVTVRKSQDPTGVLAALYKRSEATALELARSSAAVEMARVEKRAQEELPNLPKSLAVRGAIVKALEGIADAGIRKEAFEAVQAGDKAIADVTKRQGTGPGGKPDAGGPLDQLDALVKKRAADHKEDYAVAYSAVLSTTEGKQLYEQSLTAPPARA